MRLNAGALAMLLLAAACSPAEPPATSGPTFVIVEDLRIGLSQGADEYLFDNIGGIVQHDDGTISILDIQVPMIRRYDTEGVYLHDVGRGGQGPGEYSDRVQGMKRLPDDNLAIWDSGFLAIFDDA